MYLKHGQSNSREYKIWKSMKRRCNNPKYPQYSRYGGRGIGYQLEWEKFENFWKDMKKFYSENLELDRIDNDGNYTKNNCRWINSSENNRNRNNSFRAEYKGIHHLDASISLGGKRTLIFNRMKKGWPLKKAFTTPARPKK